MSTQTLVVNKHSGAPFDIYIGRGSLWGNPFPIDTRVMSADESRRHVIVQYEKHLLRTPRLLAAVAGLHSKTLQCFCAPKPCHGHVLAHYADALALTGALPVQLAVEVIYPSFYGKAA